MLSVRLLQLCLLPLALRVCEETEEVAETPVAAALVSGENSDLGKSSQYFLCPPHLTSLLSGEHPWHVGLVREESKTGFLGWVRHLGEQSVIELGEKYY